ncbi:uncharacterized protein TrAFT101_004356 [Trichoderma asperellum]|uniref:uncharacterized protein n=1 Tax=Trichoderma asperellum TaxID=101201 RepID=UPI003319B3A8|nr:hypothetical protein TrAFT101_004356 [Trichoderma asperellum]
MGSVGTSPEALAVSMGWSGQEARLPWGLLLALRGWSLATHVEIPMLKQRVAANRQARE